MLPLITGSADSENSHALADLEVPEGVPVAVGVAVGDGAGTAVGDGVGTAVVVDVAVDGAPGVPLAGLHPASAASATVQNHTSPFDSSISVRA